MNSKEKISKVKMAQATIKKIVGGAILLLVLGVIIVSFMVPQYMDSPNSNENILAVVNGKKIHRQEFMRYAPQLLRNYGLDSSAMTEQMEPFFHNMYISMVMQQQLVESQGIVVSDERVEKQIIQYFTDDEGNYRKDYLQGYLDNNFTTYSELFERVRGHMLANEFTRLVQFGVAVAEKEVEDRHVIKNSRFSLQYTILKPEMIINMSSDLIEVTEQEISDELKNNPDQVKDPKSDRDRVRSELKRRKEKEAVTHWMNTITSRISSFKTIEDYASEFNIEILESPEFTIGQLFHEEEKNAQSLNALIQSTDFYKVFGGLEIGDISRPILVEGAIYVVSPIEKNLYSAEDMSISERNSIKNSIFSEKSQALRQAIMEDFVDRSTVVR